MPKPRCRSCSWSAPSAARSLLRLQAVDPGFDPNHVVTFTLSLPSARYPTSADRLRAYEDVERRLREQPGVQAAGAVSTLALRGFTWTGDATVEGRAPADYERDLRHKSVTPDYFKAMGITLLAGRTLNDGDTIEKPPVTIVNQALARQYFRGEDALGKRVTFARPIDNDVWVTIVGIVADEKQDGLDQPARPQLFAIRQRMQSPLTFVGARRSTCERGGGGAREGCLRPRPSSLDQRAPAAVVAESWRHRSARRCWQLRLVACARGPRIYGVLAYSCRSLAGIGIRLALGPAGALFGMSSHACSGRRRAAIAGGAVATTTVSSRCWFGSTVGPADLRRRRDARERRACGARSALRATRVESVGLAGRKI